MRSLREARGWTQEDLAERAEYCQRACFSRRKWSEASDPPVLA
ncbi:hypothetical protein ACWGJW_14485 [Streptomyces nigrescens]